MPALSYRREDLADLQADRAWWALYAACFPVSEREPKEVILRGVGLGVSAALCARRDGKTVGMAHIHLLRAFPAVFLTFLAVDPAQRERRVGSELFAYAWDEGRLLLEQEGVSPRGMVLEVEKPELADDPAERAMRSRRLAFYARLGALPLPVPYLLPPVDGTSVLPLSLLFRPADGAAPPAASAVRALVRAMYREKYAAINGIPDRVLSGLLQERL